jgi:hypothetical protein
MRKTKIADRRRHWQEVIERQQASGQSVVGFCSQEGLAPATFHAWKRRLRQACRETGEKVSAPALIPVQIVDTPAAGMGNLEVRWPSGFVLRGQGFDVPLIGAVIAALSAPAARKAPRC